jgi:hypothetical protein
MEKIGRSNKNMIIRDLKAHRYLRRAKDFPLSVKKTCPNFCSVFRLALSGAKNSKQLP